MTAPESVEARAASPGRRLEPDARRAEILEAALRIYAERPYADVSTTEIAREAGVARGLLNHYFGTKRALYLEALRILLTIPEAAATDLPGRTPAERAGAAVDWFLDTVAARRGLWLSVGVGGAGGDADVDAVVEQADETAADRVLAALVPDRDPHDGALRARVRASFGLVRAASREWLVRGSLDRAGVRELLVTALVALLTTQEDR
ncbi:TetR/AcrR family transcriptional regulator [Actinomycetospora endophytica]|uniref:TetR/AcrR family transcriptional regulator n=1 Tax=Actinomycetospora endophytica TaxID=2291215 RepID=A0ABS8PCJ2_9PSEU|nr:TetR/AcrR family transcriptional regulator [Actinomycetospora endophytica]MCD2195972.1 TetR/AcrR family transcriptional regulator [Actinomycetospora endophytica]